jgi:hypothetical protein
MKPNNSTVVYGLYPHVLSGKKTSLNPLLGTGSCCVAPPTPQWQKHVRHVSGWFGSSSELWVVYDSEVASLGEQMDGLWWIYVYVYLIGGLKMFGT